MAARRALRSQQKLSCIGVMQCATSAALRTSPTMSEPETMRQTLSLLMNCCSPTCLAQSICHNFKVPVPLLLQPAGCCSQRTTCSKVGQCCACLCRLTGILPEGNCASASAAVSLSEPSNAVVRRPLPLQAAVV